MHLARIHRLPAILFMAVSFALVSHSVAYAADAAADAAADDEGAASEDQDEAQCVDGPRPTDWLMSLGGTIVGTAVVAGVGMQTLSRSLASGGHRQSSSNIAGLSLGALVGGAIGAVVMGAGACGVLNVPGMIGVVVSTVGLGSLVFAVATGRSR